MLTLSQTILQHPNHSHRNFISLWQGSLYLVAAMMISLAKYILTFNTFNWMFQTSMSSSKKSSFLLPGQLGMWKWDWQTQSENHFFITALILQTFPSLVFLSWSFRPKWHHKTTSGTFSSNRSEGRWFSINKEWPFLLPTTSQGATPSHCASKGTN